MIPKQSKKIQRSSISRSSRRRSMQTEPNNSNNPSFAKSQGVRSRSPSLEREEKYPPPLTPIRPHTQSLRESWVLHNADIIEQKSQIQQDEKLQEMIQEIGESYLKLTAIKEKTNFVDLNNQQEKQKIEEQSSLVIQAEKKQNEMQQEQIIIDNTLQMAIIQKSAIFWKRQQFNENDLKNFQDLIKDYIVIRTRPVPVNDLGAKLLKNGYFVIAYIKYMTSKEADLQVRSILFDTFKTQYEIQTNQEQFQQAYNNNLKDMNDYRSQNSSSQSKSSKRQYRFFRVNNKSDSFNSKKYIVDTKQYLKRRYSDQLDIKDIIPKSRQKYLKKQYEQLQYLVVGPIISSALGNLREFIIVKSENKHHLQSEFILIPRKKGQMINISSLNQALRQSQQITQSRNIYYFQNPGPQFDSIYSSLNQSLN